VHHDMTKPVLSIDCGHALYLYPLTKGGDLCASICADMNVGHMPYSVLRATDAGDHESPRYGMVAPIGCAIGRSSGRSGQGARDLFPQIS
jgi:hypothetical protein